MKTTLVNGLDRDQLGNKFGYGIADECLERNEMPEMIASEDGLTLWCFRRDGTEVIQTNGEPVWDTDEGFRQLKSEMSPTGL